MGVACSKKKKEQNEILGLIFLNSKEKTPLYEGSLTYFYNSFIREIQKQKKNNIQIQLDDFIDLRKNATPIKYTTQMIRLPSEFIFKQIKQLYDFKSVSLFLDQMAAFSEFTQVFEKANVNFKNIIVYKQALVHEIFQSLPFIAKEEILADFDFPLIILNNQDLLLGKNDFRIYVQGVKGYEANLQKNDKFYTEHLNIKETYFFTNAQNTQNPTGFWFDKNNKKTFQQKIKQNLNDYSHVLFVHDSQNLFSLQEILHQIIKEPSIDLKIQDFQAYIRSMIPNFYTRRSSTLQENQKFTPLQLLISQIDKGQAKSFVFTLIKIFDNMIAFPDQSKYRKLKKSNEILSDTLFSKKECPMVLRTLGFKDKSSYWLSELTEAELKEGRDLLEYLHNSL